MYSDSKLKRLCEAFAEKECANNQNGRCLPMDCPCFAFVPKCGVCTYYLNNVQPQNPSLLAEVMKKIDGEPKPTKKCAVCGAAFMPTSNRQRYCSDCAKEAKRSATAKRVREYRAGTLCNVLDPQKRGETMDSSPF